MNPIPGKQYIVQSGDSLSIIAGKAYGDPLKWPLIHDANQSTIKSDDPNLVFPGEIIVIPLLAENVALRTERIARQLGNKAKDELTIVIEDLELVVQSSRILRTMDTAADGWSCRIEWTPGEDKKLDEKTLPYGYQQASVFIGQELITNGLLYNVTSVFNTAGRAKILEGFSFTADMIDSTIKPPYEKNSITLEDRAAELVGPAGIQAVFDYESGGPFDRITAGPTDTIFGHLQSLAGQRGLLVSSTPNGALLFTKANVNGPILGTIEEGNFSTAEEFTAKFNGRKRFNIYRAISQSPKNNKKVAIAKDNNVPRSRFITFQAEDTTDGDIQTAADWKRSKQLADALTIPIPVEGWYSPSGDLWKENTLISVQSKTLFVPEGFTFLIRRVEFIYETTGKRAVLSLVPPQVYTGEPLTEPWK